MKILKTIHSLDPAAGGVATAVDALSRAELVLGHSVEVACLDDPASPWIAGRPYGVHAFKPRLLKSYGWCPKLFAFLKKNSERFDVITVEGLWQHHGLMVHRAATENQVPYVVYPHGMLDPWFKDAYPAKHWKKMLYWKVGGYKVLSDARAVAFTTEEEMRLAQNAFTPWQARCVISPLGVEPPHGPPEERAKKWRERFPTLAGRKFLLYLGRIDPKKGAQHLIPAYAKQYPEETRLRGGAPALVIAGPESAAAFAEQCHLQAEILRLRESADIVWTGMLDQEMKWAALEAADVLVLPSHQENFGYVVAEALAVGTPALISDRVNLWREVVADGAGLAAPDDEAGTLKLLQEHAAWTPATRAQFSAAARRCFLRRFQIAAAAKRQIEVLDGAD
ncbi:MAG TPA: glycosyltransferase [Opitutales bacterium]|nr:glycosyltransferase [Opitutales bacterium]